MRYNYTNSKGKNFIGFLEYGKKDTLPYILVIPEKFEQNTELIVESLNYEGTNIKEKIIPHVIDMLKGRVEIFEEAPFLIPFLPDVRGGIPYYQQLARECFEENKDILLDYPQIDSRVIKTIQDAKNKVKEETGKNVGEKIFLNGYSSSGVFAQRFALIHPEIVGRALIGGASGTIPVPTDDLEYPLGIKDFKELFGVDFNEEEYKKIQFAYYVGELEANNPACEYDIEGNPIERDERGNRTNLSQIIPPMHDMSFYPRSVNVAIGKKQRQLFGKSIADRYQACINYYEKNNYNITSKIYRGAEHRNIFTRGNPSYDVLIRDIQMFFKERKKFPRDISSVDIINMDAQNKRENRDEKIIKK